MYAAEHFAETISVWKQLAELSPDRATTHGNLAWILSTAPDVDLREPIVAVIHAQRAVDLEPVPNHWSNLGVAQLRAGNLSASIASLETADELTKGDYAHRFFLAMAYWQNGEQLRAHQAYEQGVKWTEANEPDSEEFHRFRAEAEEWMQLPLSEESSMSGT